MEFNHTETMTEWDKWKSALHKVVNTGQAIGMSNDTIEKIGIKIGNFLSSSVDPENREQRLLKELWTVGDDRDREVLAKLIVAMVKTDPKH